MSGAPPASGEVDRATGGPPEMGERVEIVLGPAPRAVIVMSFGWLALTALVAVVCAVLMQVGPWTGNTGTLLVAPLGMLLIVAGVSAVVLSCMRYELTTQRARAMWGVLSRASVEARLEHVQNVTIVRPLLERLLGLGTIRMTTAGVGPAIVWWYVAEPEAVARRLREAIDGAHGRARPGPGAARSAPAVPIQRSVSSTESIARADGDARRRLPVVGLAGGIGAGKSTVAKAFERLGCFVIDSDVRAKMALDRPEVRDQLVEWWGADVLDPNGRVNRAGVASIVFADPEQRTRLEQLVHPLVREDRAAMIKEAEGAGARAVIVDAPLLFEAGVDAECDCVVFVDAPREQRLERVRQTRGWDEQELERRECSQMPLVEKRRRSSFVVENTGKLGSVDAQVARILGEIEATETDPGGVGSAGPS